MVRFFFFVGLTATIITASILESTYIENVFSHLEKELMRIETMLESNTENIATEKNLSEIAKLTKDWHKRATRLKYLVWHTGIKDVETGLSRIASYTEENDFTEAKVELNNLLDFSRHYSKDFKVLWENIF